VKEIDGEGVLEFVKLNLGIVPVRLLGVMPTPGKGNEPETVTPLEDPQAELHILLI
jgi:hypothetical protein